MARQKRQTKASVHYVNNKEFTAAIVVHNEACKVAVVNEEDKPRVSEYIGECIYYVMELKIVYSILIILIQRNHKTHSRM